MIVVSDTTAMNYLILIGYPSVLHDLFQQVILPEAVFENCCPPQAPEEIRVWCSSMPAWCRVEAAKAIPSELMQLGAGEREAIALTEQLRADLLLIDETRGRRAARNEDCPSPVRLASLIRRLL
jgi:predicted nucleic acid-binding protein